MKILIGFFSILLVLNAEAQILEEQCSLADKPRGANIAQFNGGEKVYSFEPDDAGWYKVRKEVYLPLSAVNAGEVSAGTEFKNEDEERIGRALADIKLKEIDTVEGFRSDDRVRAIVEGYLFKTKFERGSIPEERIGEILEVKNRTEQQAMFQELWDEYQAETREFEDLRAYVIRETNRTTAVEKDFRVITIFRGSSPYAIITNGHNATAPKIKDEWEDGDFRILYLYKPSSSQRELVNEIMYTFLAL